MSRLATRRVCAWLIVAGAVAAAPASAVEVFVAIDPCRIFDTRQLADAPALENDPELDTPRTVTIQGNAACPDIPASGLTAVSANLLVVEPEHRGFLTAFPQDVGFNGTSHLNFPTWAGDVANPLDAEFANDNAGILPLDDDPTDGDLAVTWDTLPTSPQGTALAHVVIDVTGYFVELTTADGVTLTGDGPVVVGLDPAYQLPQLCETGDVPEWDGDSWECAAVAGGDVTDVFAGTGLEVTNSGGPQPTLSLGAAFTLPTGCDAGQVAEWDGDSWECADQAAGGSGAVVVSHAARHNQLSTSTDAVTYGPAGASNPTDVQETLPEAQRIEILSPESGCVAQKMRVRQVHSVSAAPVLMGVGQTRTFRLVVNGSPGDLSCTIPAEDSTCLSVNSHTIAAGGQRLSISNTNEGSGTFPAADGLITWECVVGP